MELELEGRDERESDIRVVVAELQTIRQTYSTAQYSAFESFFILLSQVVAMMLLFKIPLHSEESEEKDPGDSLRKKERWRRMRMSE